jgi:mRNA interferase RelE/StbE
VSQYQLVFAASAKKDIDKLDSLTKQRVAKKLKYFLQQEDPIAYARPLVHSSIGSYRFRVGHYRITFDIKGKDLQVVSIKHRREVYRT